MLHYGSSSLCLLCWLRTSQHLLLVPNIKDLCRGKLLRDILNTIASSFTPLVPDITTLSLVAVRSSVPGRTCTSAVRSSRRCGGRRRIKGMLSPLCVAVHVGREWLVQG